MLATDLPPEAVRSTATWTMIVALVLLVFVVGVAMWVALRRGRRLREQAQQKPKQADPVDQKDPWYEAGRRARVDDDEDEDLLV
jgi:flagellar biosynthesis/type III secretory pathway M-ring protein FliF/YscJ